jgi:hypothetical protein
MLWQRSLQYLHHGVNGDCGRAAMLGRHPLHSLCGFELSTASLSQKGASLRWTAPVELRPCSLFDRKAWMQGWMYQVVLGVSKALSVD